jgi:hypothetical protein
MENVDFEHIEKFIRILKILDYSEEDVKMILKMKGIDIKNVNGIIKYFDII